MARLLVVLGLIASIIFGWHLYGVADTRRRAEDLRSGHSVGNQDEAVSVNPLTDVVTVPIRTAGGGKPKSDNPFEALGNALGSMLGGALAKALEPTFEHELNLRAREAFDLYAIVLPYRVRVVANGGETPIPPLPKPSVPSS
jgi:hypothetical protein